MSDLYKKVAQEVAYEAGAIMRENFKLGMNKKWKEDHSPVTETDHAINSLVIKKINKNFPEHNIISEEGDGVKTASDFIWICDPVDGTHNFSHGVPTSTFVLALTEKGIPILGLIYDPFLDRMFFAEKGKGATLNEKEIHVSQSKEFKRTVIGIGKWGGPANLFPVGEELRGRDVRLIAGLSIAFMGALVAAGEFSAILFGGTEPHDTVAIKIIVEEAGGTVTDLYGNIESNGGKIKGQLASNGIIHDDLVSIIKKYNIK